MQHGNKAFVRGNYILPPVLERPTRPPEHDPLGTCSVPEEVRRGGFPTEIPDLGRHRDRPERLLSLNLDAINDQSDKPLVSRLGIDEDASDFILNFGGEKLVDSPKNSIPSHAHDEWSISADILSLLR